MGSQPQACKAGYVLGLVISQPSESWLHSGSAVSGRIGGGWRGMSLSTCTLVHVFGRVCEPHRMSLLRDSCMSRQPSGCSVLVNGSSCCAGPVRVLWCCMGLSEHGFSCPQHPAALYGLLRVVTDCGVRMCVSALATWHWRCRCCCWLQTAEGDTHPQSIRNAPDGTVRHTKGCNCKKSSCLKKYCECFQGGIFCTEICKCVDCKNFDVSGGVDVAVLLLLGGRGVRVGTP